MPSKPRRSITLLLHSIAAHPLNEGLWFGALIALLLFAPIGGR